MIGGGAFGSRWPGRRSKRRSQEPPHQKVIPFKEHTPVTDLPVISYPPPLQEEKKTDQKELVWSGHVYNLGGYAKANREILFRIRKNVRIQLVRQEDIVDEENHFDPEVDGILKLCEATSVSKKAPHLRFFTPRVEKEKRYRICFTMMETFGSVHPNFAKMLNENYSEVWTPTRWNAQIFRNSGVQKPIFIMPLGVDPSVYKPSEKSVLPPCELLTTSRAGSVEIPSGFVFINVFQPTFRKGIPFLAKSFERAFSEDPDAALLLGTTAYPHLNDQVRREVLQEAKNSRIYILSGNFSEQEMSSLYQSSDAFVCSSLGEGWNLPLCEAAACGKPCIVPRNTAHLDLVDDSCAFIFDHEGSELYPGSGSLCPWYDEMLFSKFGEKSADQLSEIMKSVKSHHEGTSTKTEKLTKKIRSLYTWDISAQKVMDRLQSIF